ncbi:MAG: hypothetical protein FJ034_00305 [Chloroflexi bacterium]|nr:hypothetical protein [Chloroflexota bacterium]
MSQQASLVAAALVGAMWSIGSIDVNAPSFERVGLFVASCALAGWALAGRRGAGALLAALAVLIGASERLQRPLLERGSDVLPATRESLQVLLAGRNPYTHTLQSTIPPGSPLVYGPGELLFYLPAHLLTGDLGHFEQWAGIATIAAIALIGLGVGFARSALPAMLYATWGIAAFRTTDGGNDVGAALVVVAGFCALALAAEGRGGRVAFIVSAVLFGLALAFKQYVVLVIPLVLRHLAVSGSDWRRFALVAAGVTALLDLPFLLMDPGAFLNQHVWLALTNHREAWGANLLFTIAQVRPEVVHLSTWFLVAEIVLTLLALALCLRWRIPTLGAAAVAGAGLVALPFFLAAWTTQSYYVYAATVAAAGVTLLDHRAQPPR